MKHFAEIQNRNLQHVTCSIPGFEFEFTCWDLFSVATVIEWGYVNLHEKDLMSESLLLLFSLIKLIPYAVISVFGRELFLFPLANLMCSSRDLLSWVNVRLHDLTFNMEIKSKQSLNFKLKGVWISLHTQPHDIRFKVCGMFHMPFLSHETRDLGTEIKLRRTKLKENVCSIVHGTTICLKKNDNRKHVIWNYNRSQRIWCFLCLLLITNLS
jgi:hypothetical protein